jgi:hypothetical protein
MAVNFRLFLTKNGGYESHSKERTYKNEKEAQAECQVLNLGLRNAPAYEWVVTQVGHQSNFVKGARKPDRGKGFKNRSF